MNLPIMSRTHSMDSVRTLAACAITGVEAHTDWRATDRERNQILSYTRSLVNCNDLYNEVIGAGAAISDDMRDALFKVSELDLKNHVRLHGALSDAMAAKKALMKEIMLVHGECA